MADRDRRLASISASVNGGGKLGQMPARSGSRTRLRDEHGYRGGITIVKDYVRAHRLRHRKSRGLSSACDRQSNNETWSLPSPFLRHHPS
jgi:hypothetical protein